MTYQRGDRIALVFTDDPHTRLRPGDKGTVREWSPETGQLHVQWDSGSALTMLPDEGDQVRLLAPDNGQCPGPERIPGHEERREPPLTRGSLADSQDDPYGAC